MIRRSVGLVTIAAMFLALPVITPAQQSGGQPGQAPSDRPGTSTATPQPPPSDQGTGNPQPAASANGLFLGPVAAPDSGSQLQPDTHVLTDSVAFTLGTTRRNSLSPSIHFSESADTGINPGTVNSVTSIGGTLNLDEFWNRSHLTIFYDGAATLYRPDSAYDTSYQSVKIVQELKRNRWLLRLGDLLSLAPQGGLAGLDAGGPALLGQVGEPSFTVPYSVPGTTILTASTLRLQNTILGDVDYDVSPRSSITFSGSYAALHFFHSGYVDSNEADGRVGYNYALGPKNSIALLYEFSQAGFNGTSSSYQTHSAMVALGRRMTGRLALEVAGGPQYILLNNFGTTGSSSTLSWTAFSSLTYQFGRTTASLAYSYGLGAMSGVFLGSQSHSVIVTATRRFSRNWSGLLNAAGSLNRNVTPTPGFANQFDLASAGANLNRNLGRFFAVTLGYEFQEQFAANGACPVVACNVDVARHVISLAVDWHMRPASER